MRLRSLDLIRYGQHTDRHLELPPGQPDLRVIYGPNEAGKSTARAALNDLLYGFGQTSDYAFVHPYNALRVGAVIETGSETLDLVRKKGRKHTVLTRDDMPAPNVETALNQILGNTDLDFFTRMFSLDQKRLREGAAQLLGQGGDGDTGLLAAGAGITDLLSRRQALAAEADSLWGPREKQGRAYAQAAQRLKAAEKAMHEHEITANQWNKLRKAAQEAEQAHKNAKKKVRDAQAERNRLERIRRVMPHIRAYQDLQTELDALGDVISLDSDAKSVLENANKAIQSADSGIREQKTRIDDLQVKINATHCDDQLLARAADIEGLVERRGRISEDEAVLTDHRVALKTTENALRTDAASLGWPLDTMASLRDKLPTQTDLAHAVNLRHIYGEKAANAQNAGQRQTDAETRKAQMQARLDALGDPVNIEELSALVTKLKGQTSPHARLQTARDNADYYQQEINRLLARLEPKVDEAELCALAPPTAYEVDRYVQSIPEAEAAYANAKEARDQAAEELRLARLDYDQALKTEGLASEEDLRRLRNHRESGWHLIRRQYIDDQAPDPNTLHDYVAGHPDLATAYERSVRDVDQAADRRFDKAETAGQLKEKERSINLQRGKLEKLEDNVRTAEHEYTRLINEWQSLWQQTGLTPAEPSAMREWLNLRTQVLEKVSDRTAANSKMAALKAELAENCQQLRRALEDAGVSSTAINEADFPTLMARAENVLQQEHAREHERQNLHRDLSTLQPELRQRRNTAAACQAELREWQQNWSQALAKLGLDTNLTATDAKTPLETLERMQGAVQKLEQQRAAINEIEDRGDAFEKSVTELIAEVAHDLRDQSALAASSELQKRLDNARQARRKIEGWSADLESARERIHELEREKSHAEETLQRLHDAAGTADPQSLADAIDRSDRQRQLKTQKDNLVKTIVEQGDGLGLDQLIQECARYTPDGINTAISELDDHIEERESAERQALEANNQARQEFEAVGGDDAYAAAASQRSQAIADMREAAEGYARVGTASILLQWAAHRYRLEKIQPLITRASDFFAKLTLDSFEKLVPVFDDEEMHIAAQRGATEPVRVQQMSEGTQDQLFLALRLASLEAYLERGIMLPFVADDLFVNFDDDRALAGLRVLAELAEKTQVLFFTHHQHLCRLATQATGLDACVINL